MGTQFSLSTLGEILRYTVCDWLIGRISCILEGGRIAFWADVAAVARPTLFSLVPCQSAVGTQFSLSMLGGILEVCTLQSVTGLGRQSCILEGGRIAFWAEKDHRTRPSGLCGVKKTDTTSAPKLCLAVDVQLLGYHQVKSTTKGSDVSLTFIIPALGFLFGFLNSTTLKP